GDGVNLLELKDGAKVFVGGRRFAHFALGFRGELLEDVRIHVANMGDAGGALVGLERRKMRIGTPVQPDDGEVEAIVGAENLTIALGGGADGQTCRACCESVEEVTSCNHFF